MITVNPAGKQIEPIPPTAAEKLPISRQKQDGRSRMAASTELHKTGTA